jgi:hypothetical protein
MWMLHGERQARLRGQVALWLVVERLWCAQ